MNAMRSEKNNFLQAIYHAAVPEFDPTRITWILLHITKAKKRIHKPDRSFW
jgi:hypothetical protein